ncbi:hypothetical protein PCE1_004996 [Barthelona sp. PCE]
MNEKSQARLLSDITSFERKTIELRQRMSKFLSLGIEVESGQNETIKGVDSRSMEDIDDTLNNLSLIFKKKKSNVPDLAIIKPCEQHILEEESLSVVEGPENQPESVIESLNEIAEDNTYFFVCVYGFEINNVPSTLDFRLFIFINDAKYPRVSVPMKLRPERTHLPYFFMVPFPKWPHSGELTVEIVSSEGNFLFPISKMHLTDFSTNKLFPLEQKGRLQIKGVYSCGTEDQMRTMQRYLKAVLITQKIFSEKQKKKKSQEVINVPEIPKKLHVVPHAQSTRDISFSTVASEKPIIESSVEIHKEDFSVKTSADISSIVYDDRMRLSVDTLASSQPLELVLHPETEESDSVELEEEKSLFSLSSNTINSNIINNDVESTTDVPSVAIITEEIAQEEEVNVSENTIVLDSSILMPSMWLNPTDLMDASYYRIISDNCDVMAGKTEEDNILHVLRYNDLVRAIDSCEGWVKIKKAFGGVILEQHISENTVVNDTSLYQAVDGAFLRVVDLKKGDKLTHVAKVSEWTRCVFTLQGWVRCENVVLVTSDDAASIDTSIEHEQYEEVGKNNDLISAEVTANGGCNSRISISVEIEPKSSKDSIISNESNEKDEKELEEFFTEEKCFPQDASVMSVLRSHLDELKSTIEGLSMHKATSPISPKIEPVLVDETVSSEFLSVTCDDVAEQIIPRRDIYDEIEEQFYLRLNKLDQRLSLLRHM